MLLPYNKPDPFKGTPYEKRPNAYDLYGYGKVFETPRANYGYYPSKSNVQLNQSVHQRPTCLNQSFSVNANNALNQSNCSFSKNPAKSFCQELDQSLNSNKDYSFRFENANLKHDIEKCFNRCKSLHKDLEKLKDFTKSENEKIKKELTHYIELFSKKRKLSQKFVGIGIQTGEDNNISFIDEKSIGDDSSDRMSVIDKIGEFTKIEKAAFDEDNLSDSDFGDREKELGPETNDFKRVVELPVVEFQSPKNTIVEKCSSKEQKEDEKNNIEIIEKELSEEKTERNLDIEPKNEKTSSIKNVWILWLIFAILTLAMILNFFM